jgi:hypothetical protein
MLVVDEVISKKKAKAYVVMIYMITKHALLLRYANLFPRIAHSFYIPWLLNV